MLFHQLVEGAKGPTTLYLHGFLGSGNNLGSLARLLAQSPSFARYALVDLPGHGRSPRLVSHATLSDLAAPVVALAKSLSNAPLRLVGHSLGGRVALTALGLAPGLFFEVVLLDIGPQAVINLDDDLSRALTAFLGAPERAANRAEMRKHFLDAQVSAGLADWLLMGLVQSESDYAWRVDRQALASLRARALATDLWPELTRWIEHVPPRSRLRCLRGARSDYVTDDSLQRMRALGVEVATLSGAGHFVHVDAPAAIAQILLSDGAASSSP